MASKLIDSTLLFEFAINIAKLDAKPLKTTAKKAASKLSSPIASHWQLGEALAVEHLAALNGNKTHSDVRVAWSESGLYFQAIVKGKKVLPRFIQPRGGFSDGLRVWIDTRCSPGIHRATRFCHCFHFFPGQPHGILDEIPRARELPTTIDSKELEVRSEFHPDGYTLWAHIPSKCLTGYSPLEFDRIRLFYDVVDQELGTQSMAIGPELRYAEDPSHWVQASLVSSIASNLR